MYMEELYKTLLERSYVEFQRKFMYKDLLQEFQISVIRMDNLSGSRKSRNEANVKQLMKFDMSKSRFQDY